MPKLGDIKEDSLREMGLKYINWLEEAIKLIEGGIYLLAGEPGIGKTTLALQIACDVAQQGKKVLYLTSEQSPSDLKAVVMRLLENINKPLGENLIIDPLASLRELDIWSHILLERKHPDYFNIKLVILDSIQAGGVSPQAQKMYARVNKFTTLMKNNKITTFLVSHVTKTGAIAGPKDLEHQVDCIIQFRKAFKLRPLFVSKNRFGPAKLDPYVLEMSQKGLLPSPYQKGKVGKVFGISLASGRYAEIQARIQIPKWGEHGGLRAPYLPQKKMQQLVNVLYDIPNIDITELTYHIDLLSRMPRINTQYDHGFDLAVLAALLSSYIQIGVPIKSGFYGEVDLSGEVRSPSASSEAKFLKGALEPSYESNYDKEQLKFIKQTSDNSLSGLKNELSKLETLYVPKEITEELSITLELFGFDVKCIGVTSIKNLIELLWPQIVE